MERLLEKSKISYSTLKRYVAKITATELSRLSEPCYYPSFKKHIFELLKICGLSEKDIKDFTKEFWEDTFITKWKTAGLERDHISNFLIFIMYALIKKGDKNTYTNLMVFFNIRYYTNLMHRMIKHCNIDVFKFTLESLVKNHLFAVHKTIGNAIFYLSKEMIKKHTVPISNPNPENISKFIRESRHRLFQSIRSFAETYYRVHKSGAAFKTPFEDEEGVSLEYQESAKTAKIINDVVNKICVHKTIDKKALMDAKTITKISTSFATMITKDLSNTKNTEEIKLILELFLKNLKSVDSIYGKKYLEYVKKLMSIKRTRMRVYFKKQIEDLLVNILKDIKQYKKYEKQSSQTKHLNKLFLAYYITMVLRNIIC